MFNSADSSRWLFRLFPPVALLSLCPKGQAQKGGLFRCFFRVPVVPPVSSCCPFVTLPQGASTKGRAFSLFLSRAGCCAFFLYRPPVSTAFKKAQLTLAGLCLSVSSGAPLGRFAVAPAGGASRFFAPSAVRTALYILWVTFYAN
jgi:hypothetical protein